jgi:predicted branched-subunit amino acid permease
MAMKLFLTAVVIFVVGMICGASGEHFKYKRLERFGWFLIIFAGAIAVVSVLIIIWVD